VDLSISVILCVVYLLHTLLSVSGNVLITSCCIVPAGKNPLDRQQVVVCYVAEWARLRQGLGSFTVHDIDPTLCTHLVYAFAVLNMTTNAIQSASPEYDLEENNGTGWCIRSTVRIVTCVNPSQVQEVQ
jgi:chitinase